MDMKSMFNGHSYHHELTALADLAGIKADPTVFRILLELLDMQIEPEALYKLLRCIRRSKASAKQSSRTEKSKRENV